MDPEANKPAAKADINRLDKKIDTVFKALTAGISDTNGRLDKLAEEMRENTSRVLGAIDAFAKKAEAYDRKAMSHGAILQDHETALRDHGRRLGGLEKLP